MADDGIHLLILGGSLEHPGGVEAFCDRSSVALQRRGGWQVNRVPTDTAYLKLRHLPRFIRSLVGLARYRSSKPDCVWLQYGNLPDLAFLVMAKMLGFRVMVTPHLGSAWRSQTNPLLRKISGRVLRLADRLALISPTQEQEINLSGSVPRSAIRNFLPEEVLTGPLPSDNERADEIQLIHSGRLSDGKGSFMVIEVCAALRQAGVPFHTRITGGADRETMDRLRRAIDDAGLEGQVELLGRIPEADLLDHLRKSDVLIHLSRIDSYPLISLEAMASATLPVCMELAGARDQVQTYGGHVVSVAGAVPETVTWITEQAHAIRALRTAGLVAAEHVRRDYSWEQCGGALDHALRACASIVAGGRMQTDPAT